MNSERIRELEKQIAELKQRWPAHSVPAAMLQQLELDFSVRPEVLTPVQLLQLFRRVENEM